MTIYRCRFIKEWKCYDDGVNIEHCKFCLEARQRWITLIKLVEEDYAENIQELTALREEKRRWEAMPK